MRVLSAKPRNEIDVSMDGGCNFTRHQADSWYTSGALGRRVGEKTAGDLEKAYQLYIKRLVE